METVSPEPSCSSVHMRHVRMQVDDLDFMDSPLLGALGFSLSFFAIFLNSLLKGLLDPFGLIFLASLFFVFLPKTS